MSGGLSVVVRVRPRTAPETAQGEVVFNFDTTQRGISIAGPVGDDRDPVRVEGFDHVFDGAALNEAVFDAAMRPKLQRVLSGAAVGCFCYGHTGSGKSHTIIGYGAERGLISQSVDALFAQQPTGLCIAVTFCEIYNDAVFDLLDPAGTRQQLHVRVDGDGEVQFRGDAKREADTGRVWPTGLTQVLARDAAEVEQALQRGLRQRAVGTSNLHTQSSRSHAVFQCDVVTDSLLDAKAAVRDAEADLTPYASARDAALLAYDAARIVRDPETGRFVGRDPPRALYDAWQATEAALAPFQRALDDAEAACASVRAACAPQCGALVFVDLAGAESALCADPTVAKRQSRAELKEARQINTSLLALKECIRTMHTNALGRGGGARVPFRDSKLTMVLKRFFTSAGYTSVMIATVCPITAQLQLTRSTLAYAQLVARCATSIVADAH